MYEDNHLLVAEKSPGILSQADDTGDPDMLSLLKTYIKTKYAKPGNIYLGLVHRLDRPTGGLMVFARTSKAASRLSEQVREGVMEREYLLVCEGTFAGDFLLTDWLLKDTRSNIVTVVRQGTANARNAVLRGKPLAVRDGKTLARVSLQTGRGHQIRVQMANAGHPLYGDRKYGAGGSGEEIALYSCRLAFTHPVTKALMTFEQMPRGGAFAWFGDLLGDVL
jgi:23S rRNA pseudouridine1911/1915/1917 synthase